MPFGMVKMTSPPSFSKVWTKFCLVERLGPSGLAIRSEVPRFDVKS